MLDDKDKESLRFSLDFKDHTIKRTNQENDKEEEVIEKEKDEEEKKFQADEGKLSDYVDK